MKQDAHYYFMKGNSKSSLRDYNSAISYYNKAIELDPQFADAFRNRSLAKKLLGDIKGAKEDMMKSEEMRKNL